MYFLSSGTAEAANQPNRHENKVKRTAERPPTQRHKRRKGISFDSNNESRSTSRDTTMCEKAPDNCAEKSNYSTISFTSMLHCTLHLSSRNEAVTRECKQRIKFGWSSVDETAELWVPAGASIRHQPPGRWIRTEFELPTSTPSPSATTTQHGKIVQTKSIMFVLFLIALKAMSHGTFSCFFRRSPCLCRSLHVFCRDNKYVKIYAFRKVFQQHFYSNVFRHILASRSSKLHVPKSSPESVH